MTIYIHGFGSAGESGKAKLFREYFKSINKPFIAPSLSYVPQLAISTLEELIQSYESVTLIGSSLGGYYAIYLVEKYGLKAVLINPAINSTKTLKRAITSLGYATNFYDNSSFQWRESHLDMLKKYKIDTIESNKYLLLLQKGDDVLDYMDAVEKIPNATMVIEEGGTHQFQGIERYFNKIEEFFDVL